MSAPSSIITVFALALGLCIAGTARANGIIVGSFCVEGVSAAELPNAEVEVADGVSTGKVYSYDIPKSGVSGARVVVFNKPLTTNDSLLPTCANAKAAAQAQGASVVLDGNLQHLSMTIHHLSKDGVNSYIIAPDGFVATIGKVTSGFSTVGGGTLDLKGSQAWIENPGSRINIASGGMTGVLRIESWNRTLQNAVFKVASGGTFRQTLRATGASNLKINLDTSTGRATLYDADLSANAVVLQGLAVDGEVATFNGANLKLRTLSLRVKAGRGSMAMLGALGNSASGTIGGPILVADTGATDLGWAEADTAATANDQFVQLTNWIFKGLNLASPGARLKLSGVDLITGKAQASFAELGSAQVDGQLTYAGPEVPPLAFALPPGSIPSAQITFLGSAKSLKVGGKLQTSRVAIGGLAFKVDTPLSFIRLPTDPAIKIPVNIHVGDLGGSFEASDKDQNVVLTATLKRLDLSGQLVIDLTDVSQSHLDVPNGKFRFGIGASAASKPFLAGTKPALAQVGVSATNTSDVSVRKSGGVGDVDITTSTLILGQPIFRVGDDGQQARVSADITSVGNAILRYDLAASKMRLVEGSFSLDNIHIASLDPGFVANFGNVLIDQADVKLQHLALVVPKGQPGAVNGASLVLSGSAIRSSTKDGDGATFHGDFSGPFTIQSIDGVVSIDDKNVALSRLDLHQISFGVSNTVFDAGHGMRLTNASLHVKADQVRSLTGLTTGNGVFLTNFNLKASGNLNIGGAFSLDNQPRISNLDVTLNGRVDLLNGGGQAQLDGLIGRFNSQIATGFNCSDGVEVKIPVTGRLATGPSVLTVTAKDGQFDAVGDFASFGVALASTQTKSCLSEHKSYDKEAVWGSMTGWCPTWREPGRTCTWSTIIVPAIHIGYRIKFDFGELSAIAALTAPRIRLTGNTGLVCNRGSIQLTAPSIIAGYAPQLDDNGVLAQAVNALVEASAVATESTLFTSLLNSTSLLVSDPLIDATGTSFCVINGHW